MTSIRTESRWSWLSRFGRWLTTRPKRKSTPVPVLVPEEQRLYDEIAAKIEKSRSEAWSRSTTLPRSNRQSQYEIDLMSIYLNGGDVPSEVIQEHVARQISTRDFYPGEKRLPGLEAREYIFTREHKITPPRGALYHPARITLTLAEEVASALPDLLTGVKLKPALKKKLKLKDESKNVRRVWFDSDGKMHDEK